jgi:hypothetical protein
MEESKSEQHSVEKAEAMQLFEADVRCKGDFV